MKDTRSLLYIAMMATVLIVLGFIPGIPLGFIPVPIILQNLGVMLAGVLLGGKKGSLSIFLLYLLALFIPAFSGNTLLPVLAGPTAGYVISWVFVPLLVNFGLKRFNKPSLLLQFVVIFLAGVIFVDFIGAAWLASYTHISLAKSLLSNLIFIPGDTIKAVIATIISYKFAGSLNVKNKI